MMKATKLTAAILCAGTLLLAGCGAEDNSPAQDTGSSQTTEAAPAALPAELFLAAAPAGAVPVSEARAAAKPGDPVVLTGYVGGRSEPFTEGRALFLLADLEIAPPCSDGCPNLWDACCTPNDVIAANSATIQVVDAEGKTVRVGLNGQGGLAPGATVTVLGTVHQADEAVLVVNATGISVAAP